MNRQRRKFVRQMGRWIWIPLTAAAANCTQSPTGPTATDEPQPLTSGVTTTDSSLIDLLRAAHHQIDDQSNLVSTGRFRRFVGLNNEPGTQWYIYLNDVRYGVGTAPQPNIDMPSVSVVAGTTWRIEKPTLLSFIPTAVLLALGWFFNRRNRVATFQPTSVVVPGAAFLAPSLFSNYFLVFTYY